MSTRLVGAKFYAEPPLDYMSYVQIDDLTVLFGPNGAGKSTALRGLAAVLTMPDHGEEFGEAVYLSLSPEQMETVLAAALGILANGRTLAMQWRSEFPLQGWVADDTYAPPADWRDSSPVVAWQAVLRSSASAQSNLELGAAVEALASSTTIAVEPVASNAIVLAYWCLPGPLRSQPPLLAAAIERSGLREVNEASTQGLALGASEARVPLIHPDAPVIAAPIGLTSASLLPTAIEVGIDTRAPEERFQRSVTALIDALVQATTDDKQESEALLSGLRGEGTWLETQGAALVWDDELTARSDAGPDEETTRVRPLARAVVTAAKRMLNNALPAFVRDAIEFHLALPEIRHLRETGEVQIELWREPLRPVGGKDIPSTYGDTYSLNEAAAGHRLWLELALCEAALGLSSAAQSAETLDLSGFADAEEIVRHATDEAASTSEQARVYLIDEPERHLHPALAREAARWLQDLARRPNTQVILATHSPLFLRLTGDVVWNYIEPDAGEIDETDDDTYWRRSRIKRFTPHETDAFSAMAATMGFDRGELLANLSLILFVEGEADREVLQALFGPELHGASVGVIPIHGAAKAEKKGIADSELLLRFTTTKLGLLLDNLHRSEIETLISDAAYREKALASRTVELRTMARIIRQAIERDREIQPIGIAVHDIFDLLDEALLQERFPKFPGHDPARAASAAAMAGWKTYYAEHYGIDLLREPQLLSEIAIEMRSRSAPLSPDLMALRDDILGAASRGRRSSHRKPADSDERRRFR